MKKLPMLNSILTGVAAIIFGGLLLYWQRDFFHLLVLILGWIAILIGVVQFFGFLSMTRHVANRWNLFPFTCALSIIIGVLLVVAPAMWVDIFMLLMGVVMAVLAISQIVGLSRGRKMGYETPWWTYIFPVLLLMAGIIVLLNPAVLADVIVIFIGVWIIFYGVTQVVAYFLMQNKRLTSKD